MIEQWKSYMGYAWIPRTSYSRLLRNIASIRLCWTTHVVAAALEGAGARHRARAAVAALHLAEGP